MPPETRYARSGAVNIAYQVVGDGSVDLLWIPVFAQHVELSWEEPHRRAWLESLASDYRLIVFDKRGTGLSDRVPVDRLPSLDERIDDITTVLDAVGSTSAVVYGQNHGAPLALLFAATFLERTESLILLDAFARFTRAPGYPWGFPSELAPQVVALMEEHWDEPHALRQIATTR